MYLFVGTTLHVHKCIHSCCYCPQTSRLNRKLSGNVGTALIPGTPNVIDRQTQKLVPCTPQLCSESEVELVGLGKRLINRAPRAGVAMTGLGINNRVSKEWQKAAGIIVDMMVRPKAVNEVSGC